MIIESFLDKVNTFYTFYLFVYISILFISVLIGSWHLYKKDQMLKFKSELKSDYYIPVSIIVAAYNEEVTIVDSIKSLLKSNYKLYEIIIVDDGSSDDTASKVIEAFNLKNAKSTIYMRLKCKPYKSVYEANCGGIKLTLIRKVNGGKGDALNMGINAAKYPYFLGIDADSMLQPDSLEKIVQPMLEDDSVVAVGGLIRVSQCLEYNKNGEIIGYHLPLNPVTCMQVVEYDRSFLASKILMDKFNGNLIISGAFGLFKKDIVIAAGGYDTNTLGEDMELVLKIHAFCRNNNRKYSIRYEPNAVCWSQIPSSIGDLIKQRRRWYLGLFQCMVKYNWIFANLRFGLVSLVSYMYFLFFELLSPVIEVFGVLIMLLNIYVGINNLLFMVDFFLLYSLFGIILSTTSFFQTIYTQNLKIKFNDALKAVIMCIVENFFFRYFFSFVRMTAFVGYKKRKLKWGEIKRTSQQAK